MNNLKYHPEEVITNLLNHLLPRSRDVIVRRFGIEKGDKETLESIGQDYNITRERVRQIEEDAIKNIKKNKEFQLLDEIFEIFRNHFQKHGDLRKEETIFCDDVKCIVPEFGTLSRGIVYFLLVLGDNFHRYSETDIMHSSWTISHDTYSEVRKILNNLVKEFKKSEKLVSRDDLLELIEEIIYKLNKKQFLRNKIKISEKEQVIFSWLDTSKEIASNIYGEYGLYEWPEINPKDVKSKIYLILKKENKPLHFSEITNLINKAGFSEKLVNLQTVHNELIRDDRFVLIGRGIYALREWGYEPGTVQDIIISILKINKRPLSKEEIMNKVLEQRRVQKNTILLNLQNRNLFLKTDKGFVLKK